MARSNNRYEKGKYRYPLLNRRKEKNMGTILVVILILAVIGVLPTWSHSRSWGYYPSGGLGLVVLIVLILLLTGRI